MTMTDACEGKSSVGGSTQTTRELKYELLRSRKATHGNYLTPVQLLWRSVLAQAIRDLYSSVPEDREETIAWLGSKDFIVVTEYADVEPENMLEQMTSLATMPTMLARKYGNILREEIMRGVYHN